MSALRDAAWIAGCDRCRSHLVSLCVEAGYEPQIGYTSDDMVVMQALVAAGLGVTAMPGLALGAHRAEGIIASELHGSQRHIYAATYGEPPDPPAPPPYSRLSSPRPLPRPRGRPPRRRVPEPVVADIKRFSIPAIDADLLRS
jgi:DNA-binding transcriptional LysR family regulator